MDEYLDFQTFENFSLWKAKVLKCKWIFRAIIMKSKHKASLHS